MGDRYKTVDCNKQLPCPEDDDLNEKPGQCEDMAHDCSAKIVLFGGRKECRQQANATWATENCKKTCQFCKRRSLYIDTKHNISMLFDNFLTRISETKCSKDNFFF